MKSSTNSSQSALNVFTVSVGFIPCPWASTRGTRARCARRPPASDVPLVSAHPGDVGSLAAPPALHDLEFDPLALGQGTETVTPNGREVHEHVLSPVEVDEPVAFGLVEPLHRAPETAFVRHRALGPGTRRRPRAPAMLAAPTSRPSIGTMATIAVLAV